VWGGKRVEWVVREGVGAGGEMTQALYAHMNNKKIKIEIILKKKFRTNW
jgi:NaMN:DMB phosphoribosyltransferase